MNKKLTLKNANIAIEDSKIIIDFDENDLIEEAVTNCTSAGSQVELGELNPGDEFVIGSSIYVVVDHIDDTTQVISKGIAHKMPFDQNEINNYFISDIRDMLISHDYNRIADCVGAHNIVPTLRDTTALDGSKGYDALEDNITILSFDEYRKYRNILTGIQGFTNTPQWLLTPFATCRDTLPFVCIIDNHSIVDYRNSCDADTGVRLFFTLKSSTEVEPCEPANI